LIHGTIFPSDIAAVQHGLGMGFWKIFGNARTAPVGDIAGLSDFLDREAAFLSQQASIEYSRARTGLLAQRIFNEDTFIAALEVCRWEAFAAVLADMIVITEGRLRPLVGPHQLELRTTLEHAYGEILARYPLPEHRQQGWGDVLAALPTRLARAQLGPPRPPHKVAVRSAKRLFDTLPFHPSVRKNDKEMVVNSVRFGMIRFCERMARDVSLDAIATAIVNDSRRSA
jgi:hypothetical protein